MIRKLINRFIEKRDQQVADDLRRIDELLRFEWRAWFEMQAKGYNDFYHIGSVYDSPPPDPVISAAIDLYADLPWTDLK